MKPFLPQKQPRAGNVSTYSLHHLGVYEPACRGPCWQIRQSRPFRPWTQSLEPPPWVWVSQLHDWEIATRLTGLTGWQSYQGWCSQSC
jgi:hypothetical protein